MLECWNAGILELKHYAGIKNTEVGYQRSEIGYQMSEEGKRKMMEGRCRRSGVGDQPEERRLEGEKIKG